MDKYPIQKIIHLVDAPGAMEILLRWFVEEWEPWYGPSGDGDARRDLSICENRDQLPICLVAFGENERVLGTASIRPNSVNDETSYGPWLVAMLVGKDYRGRGIGTSLVQAVEQEARRLKIPSIYTATEAIKGTLLNRGWLQVGSTGTLRGDVPTYCLNLAKDDSS